MRLNLRSTKIFENDELDLDKKITFVYGKNGTGKSTLVKIIKEQCTDYDVRVFQGFENLIDDNKRLNAVVLGEENTIIRRKIEELENQITELNAQRNLVKKEIEKPENDTITNYWTRHQQAQEACAKKESEIAMCYKKAASAIKNQKAPQVSSTSYDTRAFQRDVSCACLLKEKEMKQCIEILKSDMKIAKNVIFPKISAEHLAKEVENILLHKVEEKIKISRLENDAEKRNFAEIGRRIHKKGDVCAFCGNKINDKVFEELERYFSADEVQEFREQIKMKTHSIKEAKKNIEQLEIDEEDFYPELKDEVLRLKNLIEGKKNEHINLLNALEVMLNKKLTYLFESISSEELYIPADFSEESIKYNVLKSKNNENDLAKQQENAREKLRLHYVKEQLDIYEIVFKKNELGLLEKQKERANNELVREQLKISGENGIDRKIISLQNDIKILQDQTRNEKILAHNINNKLRYMVSFELQHCEGEGEQGYYMVKNTQTQELRDITQLSTGEKNIIAFLYFLEKLNEIREVESKPKFIVFDDPMNSNDDNMQYLIIEELQFLMKHLQGNDEFILLTHNNHFYLNVKYSFKYKENLFVRLQSNGNKTAICILTKEGEDFTTSYQAMWRELIFLYNNEAAAPSMLLNPMRRIIETYTKFNAVSHNAFCAKKSGAMKLLNVNSHSIDDLEADLCGKNKTDIVNIFCSCFFLNNALEHFKSFWSEYDISFLEADT